MIGKRLCGGIAAILLSAITCGASAPAFAQLAQGEVQSPSGDWSLSFTPYGWLVFLNGSQTVKGRSATVDTNVFQMFDKSQSLIPFMGTFEARYQDRFSLFADVMYMNLTAADSATKSYSIAPGVGANVAAQASINYETLTLQFGGAYQVAKVGPDHSAEGPSMAGVGQTAFDVLGGGRYWFQRADLTLNMQGSLNVNVPDLEFSIDRSKAIARSGTVQWLDPFVGFRVRHKLAPGQDLSFEADMGGFGLGSRISAQALGAYRLNVGNTGSIAWSGLVGYRALYVDYSQGWGSTLFEMNVVQHGPVLGMTGRF